MVSEQRIIPLRDYQQPIIPAVRAAFDRGIRRQLLVMATGGGKTISAGHIIREFDWRTVFVVHRDELAKQAVNQLGLVNPTKSIGIVKAELDDTWADIVVASAQTLANQSRLARLKRSVESSNLLHVEDEAHHSAAPTRQRVIEDLSADLLVGLTATPMRGDGVGLGKVYDEVVFELGLLDLMRAGRLAPLKGVRVETGIDIDSVRTRAGEFMESDLADAVDTSSRNKVIVDSWKSLAEGRKRTVAFCVNVAHAEHLRDAFTDAGARAEMVLGTTPSGERAEIFSAFHAGKVDVLVNVMVLTEGYDEPAIDCIILARPTKSQGLMIQMVGRGARTSPLKEDCLVIDVSDSTTRHTLVGFTDLAGDVDEVVKSEAKAKPGEVIDLLQMVEQSAQLKVRRTVEVDLFGRSPLLWQSAGAVFYAPAGVSDVGNTWVVVMESGDGYMPVRMTIPRDRYSKPSTEPLFDRAVDIDIAKGLAEDAVQLSNLTRRDAVWRQRKDPPSEAQLRFARSLGIRAGGMTKAELSSAIDEKMFVRYARKVGIGV